MSNNEKITVENMNLHYGKFHALKNINHGRFRRKKSQLLSDQADVVNPHLLKSLNRMNDLVEGCVITGKVQLGR